MCLIPTSAHGTNPASAQMAGMVVVPVKAAANGDVDLDDFEAKAAQHSARLAAAMITYPRPMASMRTRCGQSAT